MRRVFIVMGALVCMVLISAVALKVYGDLHFYDGYSSAIPLNAKTGDWVAVDGEVEAFHVKLPARYRKQSVSFESRPGERVPAVLTLPFEEEPVAPYPTIILLHGSHQEKEFIEDICTPFNEAGFAMICFDQYMRGERKIKGSVLTTMRAFRERCRKTVHDTQRLIDYLETRSDVDPQRIYLIGASYGAITGTVAVAREKRIKAAALVVGGGNFRLLAKAPEVRKELPQWMWPLAGPLMVLAAGAADPVHHAAQTSGTPVIMLNGSKDGVVIPEAGEALFAALGEPKEIRWYPVDHPDREPNGEEVIKMLGDGLAWFVEKDAPHRSSGEMDASIETK